MPVYADRCQEASTTTGTGPYTMAGATPNMRTFLDGVGAGAEVAYVAIDSAAAGWEVGIGTVSVGGLTRNIILSSSNAGAEVVWGVGTRTISIDLPASLAGGAPGKSTALGMGALQNNVTDEWNNGQGYQALYSCGSGGNNDAMGYRALYANISGNDNSGFGYYALSSALGNFNTAVGSRSLQYLAAGGKNVGIGYQAGAYVSFDNDIRNDEAWGCIYIGAYAEASGAGVAGEIVIGTRAEGSGENSVTIGNQNLFDKTVLFGRVGVNTRTPHASAALDIKSNSKAFLPPRMSSAERAAITDPTAGMLVFDTTLNKLAIFTTVWEAVTSTPIA